MSADRIAVLAAYTDGTTSVARAAAGESPAGDPWQATLRAAGRA